MTDGEIAERYQRFAARIDMPAEADWLNPPVSDAEVAATEEELGFELPHDLVELLSIHNGVRLFDSLQWIGCFEPNRSGLAVATRYLRELVDGQLHPADQLDLAPGPRTLQVAMASQEAILYDPDGQPARMLYMDVQAQPSIIPLASDLVALIDCYLDLADAGFLTVSSVGPEVDGPLDDVRHIYVRNGVAHALETGIATWLSWPGSEDVTIE